MQTASLDALVPATPPRYGSLIQSAYTPVTGSDTIDGQRWLSGLAWRPEQCGNISGTHWICPPSGGDPPDAKTVDPDDLPDNGSYSPVTIWTGDICSPVGADDLAARAERQLAACESRIIEQEVWSGDAALARNVDNAYLAMTGTVTSLGNNVPLVSALAELEQALGECACGGVPMVHASRATVTHWVSQNAVTREGNMLVTALGTIVVAGEGYDGSSPAGAAATVDSAWAYGTGQVTVLRGPVVVIPDDISEALDRTNNQVTFRAEREVAAVWDPCCHLGIQVDHSTVR